MSNPDQNQRFLFEQGEIRGQVVGLSHSYREVLSKHTYPKPVAKLLGQFMAASSLLASTLKFQGSLILQVSGHGQVRTLMAECNDQGQIRAIGQYNDDFVDSGSMLGDGQLAITIDPTKGQRYQGIVLLTDGDSLAQVLEDYFERSEQIRTRIWLASDEQQAAGFMIQAMPTSAEKSSLSQEVDDIWTRIETLSDTLTDEELLALNNETLLYRLFHEEQVRLFEATELVFHCGCSRERSGNAIRYLGLDDARQLVKEQGYIAADCQFCHSHYSFDAEQVEALFAEHGKDLN